MSQSDWISEDGEWLSPSVDIQCDPAITLHWANTVIRTFGFPFKHMDHIEFRDDEGTLKGLRVTQELMDMLFEREFPQSFSYFPEQSDVDWFVRADTADAAQLDVDGLPPTFDGML
jgi:hypothetical protein